jgi:hypothetical protein
MNGKHSFVRRVRELPKAVGYGAIAVVGASGLALGLIMSGGAGASIVGDPVYTHNGEAGAHTFGGQVNEVSGSIYIRAAAKNLTVGSTSSSSDAVGVQLCNNNTGEADQLGFIQTAPGVFAVAWAHGDLTSTGNPCVGVGSLSMGNALGGSNLADLSVGDTVNYTIKFSGRHDQNATFSAYLVGSDSVWSAYEPGDGFYATQAGAGLQQSLTSLGGAPVTEAAAIRDLTVGTPTGSGDFGVAGGQDAVTVFSSATGNPPPLVDSTLSGSVLKVYEAAAVGA